MSNMERGDNRESLFRCETESDYRKSTTKVTTQEPEVPPLTDSESEPIMDNYDIMSIAKLFIDEQVTTFIRDNFDQLYDRFQSTLKENIRELVGSFMEAELE